MHARSIAMVCSTYCMHAFIIYETIFYETKIGDRRRNIKVSLSFIRKVSFLRRHLRCACEKRENVAETVEEACKLAEIGFEHFTTIEGSQIFRKRK